MLSFRPMTRLSGLIVGSLFLLLAGPGHAADAAVESFFGVYQGETTYLTATGAKKRAISVSFRSYPEAMPGVDGVELSWTTLSKRADNTWRSKTHEAVFVPADEAGTIFVAVKSSGSAEDISRLEAEEDGKADGDHSAKPRSPGDPRGTAPYLWGRIKENTFSVYVVVVAEDGGYEVQVYDRTLTDEGMTLVYSRNRAGEHLKLLEAFLKRKES